MSAEQRDVIVVCPVYNEPGDCLLALAEEWEKTLDAHASNWEWVFIDDGSNDPGTREALREIAAARPRFKVWRTPNRGHGQACLFGYKMVRGLTRWILQVDSDGQCRVEDFPALWNARKERFHQFGVRATRDDGAARRWISAGVRLYLWALTGVRHPDANCPFRLLFAPGLDASLEELPYGLANMALSLRLFERSRFSRIGFARRRRGESTHRVLKSLRSLLELRSLELSPRAAPALPAQEPCSASGR